MWLYSEDKANALFLKVCTVTCVDPVGKSVLLLQKEQSVFCIPSVIFSMTFYDC